MSPLEAGEWLRAQADSYGRDAATFRHDGDHRWGAAYEAIARELRACADHLDPVGRDQGVLDLGSGI